jgi:hypothetical protein
MTMIRDAWVEKKKYIYIYIYLLLYLASGQGETLTCQGASKLGRQGVCGVHAQVPTLQGGVV